jgi:hypothetical protein
MSTAFVDAATQDASDWSKHARFAIYYAPPRESRWWTAGSVWLGRDAQRRIAEVPDAPDAFDAPGAPGAPGVAPPGAAEGPADALAARDLVAADDLIAADRRAGEAPPYEAHAPHPPLSSPLAELTAAPRRYGWHGTLVAPFRLADGVRADDLLVAVQRWARTRTGFNLPVAATIMGDFVALRPASDEGDALMRGLATDALRTFAPLRAASTAAERERRLAGGRLSERQQALLAEWGYPYVLDEFRFHMTLSGALASAHDCVAMVDWWQREAERLGPLPVHGVALFVEPAPGEPFVLWQRLAFRTAEE